MSLWLASELLCPPPPLQPSIPTTTCSYAPISKMGETKAQRGRGWPESLDRLREQEGSSVPDGMLFYSPVPTS